MCSDITIEQFAIGCSNILDIRHIFQSSFNLKRHSTCLYELSKVIALVHILQGKKITLTVEHLTIGIEQVELHATELGTCTSIGTTIEAILRSIAETAIADTQSTMNEDLEVCLRFLTVDIGNLVSRELTCQHHTGKTKRTKPTYFLCSTVISLCAGMNRKSQLLRHLHNPHILHQDSINMDISQLF